jgi:hypothetical protein
VNLNLDLSEVSIWINLHIGTNYYRYPYILTKLGSFIKVRARIDPTSALIQNQYMQYITSIMHIFNYKQVSSIDKFVSNAVANRMTRCLSSSKFRTSHWVLVNVVLDPSNGCATCFYVCHKRRSSCEGKKPAIYAYNFSWWTGEHIRLLNRLINFSRGTRVHVYRAR